MAKKPDKKTKKKSPNARIRPKARPKKKPLTAEQKEFQRRSRAAKKGHKNRKIRRGKILVENAQRVREVLRISRKKKAPKDWTQEEREQYERDLGKRTKFYPRKDLNTVDEIMAENARLKRIIEADIMTADWVPTDAIEMLHVDGTIAFSPSMARHDPHAKAWNGAMQIAWDEGGEDELARMVEFIMGSPEGEAYSARELYTLFYSP